MNWDISKEFEFDYGHRVWTQEPDKELSCDHKCVCRHLHGHRGKVIVHMIADKLNPQGMVTDFVNLNWFKKFLDDAIDHKMILDINDPALPRLFPLFDYNDPIPYILREDLELAGNTHPEVTFYSVDPECYSHHSSELQELYEGLVLVEFVPTSELLAKWLFDVVQKKMAKLNVTISHIEFYETPKSRSIYYGN